MITSFVSGLVAGFGIAIPVGAIAVLVVDAGIRRGFRHGAAAGAGAATADLVYALIAAVAGAVIAPALTTAAPLLRVVSGLVLIGLAMKGLYGLREPAQRRDDGMDTPAAGTFARFFGLTLVNPLTVVYFAALVLGASVAVGGAASVIAFTVGAFTASLSWQLLLAAFGTWAGKTLPHRTQLVTAVLGNGVILFLGTMAVTRGMR